MSAIRSAGFRSSAESTNWSRAGATSGRLGRRLRQLTRDDRLGRRPGVWRFAGEHLIEHCTQRVHVCPGIDRALTHRLLRAHVRRRSERQTCLSEAFRLWTAGVAGDRARDPKVRHLHVAILAEQDVAGFHIAVKDALSMRERESRCRLACNAQRVVDRKRAVATDAIGETSPGEERHREPEVHGTVRGSNLARVVQRTDMRMLKPSGELHLAREPVGADRCTERGVEDFERERSAVCQVCREVHGTHATAAEQALNAESLGERRRDELEQAVGHGRG